MLTRLCVRAPPKPQTELRIWLPDEQKISDLTGRNATLGQTEAGEDVILKLSL